MPNLSIWASKYVYKYWFLFRSNWCRLLLIKSVFPLLHLQFKKSSFICFLRHYYLSIYNYWLGYDQENEKALFQCPSFFVKFSLSKLSCWNGFMKRFTLLNEIINKEFAELVFGPSWEREHNVLLINFDSFFFLFLKKLYVFLIIEI